MANIYQNLMNNSFVKTGIANIQEYINLSGKMNKQNARKILTEMFKQYIRVDECAISPLETSINGFKFHIVEREELKYEAELTDHYIDTNQAVQDHVAWKPIEVTLTLQQGEYFNDIMQNKGHSLAYYQVMSTVTSLLPKNSTRTVARKIKSAISRATGGKGLINSIANKVTSISYGVLLSALKQFNFDLFGKNTSQTQTNQNSANLSPLANWRSKSPQVEAVVTMEALWRAGSPIKLITSWKTFNEMVITNMRVTRDNNADITEFTITLKELRTTQSLALKQGSKKTASGRAEDQKSDVVSGGLTQGEEVTFV